jgi:hypothetical protein
MTVALSKVMRQGAGNAFARHHQILLNLLGHGNGNGEERKDELEELHVAGWFDKSIKKRPFHE